LFAAVNGIVRGWAQVEQGEHASGLVRLRRSLDAYRAIGADSGLPQYFAMLAEAHARAGQADEGLAAVGEALAIMDRTDERWFEADLHRLRGELLRASAARPAETEACFARAIEVARERGARTLELRAAAGLARVLRDAGRTEEARRILAGIHDGFDEGRDTRDLAEATALLAELA
jgi:predicted ATPase